MKACADGKTIEFSERGENRWIERSWDDSRRFDWIHYDYRIKKEPVYRPFKDKEECWNEMQKHQPFGWLKNKTSESPMLIGNVYTAKVSKEVYIVWAIDEKESYSASKVFTHYVFADGTPFGIKED